MTTFGTTRDRARVIWDTLKPALGNMAGIVARRLPLKAKRFDVKMLSMGPKAKRATVYLDPDLHTALRLKAAETDTSISDLVGAAVRRSLAEDAEDLAAFRERAKEPNIPFEVALRTLRNRGRI